MKYDNIIDRTKEIETILTNIGATGKGLHEKVSSIENNLNKSVVKAIRYIATIRNNSLHDSDFKLTTDIIDEFEDAFEMVHFMLNIEITKSKSINKDELYEAELSGFEKDIIKKSKENYVDTNNTKPRNISFNETDWNYCPNCEEDVVNFRRKEKIENINYLVKYCMTCQYVFSSKTI
jgi:hypothetical protein